MTEPVFILGAFAVLIIILTWEMIYQNKYKIRLYNLADSIVNAACGISERTFSIFLDSVLFVVFSYIYSHIAIWHIPNTIANWFILLIVMDFVWYWYHRWGHVTRFLWAIHSLHHQSEEYNISVGFRISIFQTIMRSIFWMILPVFGFTPEAIFSVLVFHGIYQLPLHTRVIPRLGILEYIIVTPSTHRVHHGVNEPYLDKNYGGVFVIWDLLFGTYAKEVEPVNFGITEKTGRLDFIRAHWHGFVQVFDAVKYARNFGDWIAKFFGKPGGDDVPKKEYARPPQFFVTLFLRNYLFFQIVSCFVMTILLLFYQQKWEWYEKMLATTMIAWSLIAITSRRRIIRFSFSLLEAIRNVISVGIILLFETYSGAGFWFLILFCTASLISILFLPWKTIEAETATA
jgi:sterol desaturase/sphingolipid hydroxylase (fatty acid hydroxylase superfamily)